MACFFLLVEDWRCLPQALYGSHGSFCGINEDDGQVVECAYHMGRRQLQRLPWNFFDVYDYMKRGL